MQDPVVSPTSSTPAGGRGFEWLLRAALYLYAFSLFAYLTPDSDLWGHLKFGELTWQNGSVVRADPYSFTAPGHLWVNHEWLTELLFFFIYTAAGSTGLLVFKGALGVFIVHALTSLYLERSRNFLFFAGYALLAVPVMAPGFMTRPHLLTFLFLTLLWMVLQRGLDGRPRLLWWTPVIFGLWVNCHGGVVAGLGILGVVTLIEGTRAALSRQAHWKILAGAFAASCLAVLINPYGWKLWVFFAHSLPAPREITEWDPVALGGTGYLQLKILAVLFGLSLLLPVRKRGWEAAVILVALVFAFRHQRHSVLAAILLCPYLPLMFAQFKPRWDFAPAFHRAHADFKRAVYGIAAVLLVLQAVNIFGKFQSAEFQIVVEPLVYPTNLAQFMERNRIDGNLWVPFDWGEYFIWKRTQSRVSVDGRFRTVYPEAVLERTWAFAAGRPGFDRVLADYPVRCVITSSREPAHRAMERAAGWVKIYQDRISKLFVRADDPLVEKFRSGALQLPIEPPPYYFPG